MAQIDAAAERCGYSTYSATHVTFPPKGLLPLPGKSTEGDPGCFLWEEVFDAALLVNPAFDIYRIFDTVCIQLSQRYYIPLTVLVGNSSQFCGMFLGSRELFDMISFVHISTNDF